MSRLACLSCLRFKYAATAWSSVLLFRADTRAGSAWGVGSACPTCGVDVSCAEADVASMAMAMQLDRVLVGYEKRIHSPYVARHHDAKR